MVTRHAPGVVGVGQGPCREVVRQCSRSLEHTRLVVVLVGMVVVMAMVWVALVV